GLQERESVRAAFERSGSASTGIGLAAVERGLGAYRDAWIKARHVACEATRVERTQSETMLDLRMVCLESRRRQAAAVVSLFSSADDPIVTNARATLDALPTVASCGETPQLLAMDPPPRGPEARAELARLDGEVMRALALHEAYK